MKGVLSSSSVLVCLCVLCFVFQKAVIRFLHSVDTIGHFLEAAFDAVVPAVVCTHTHIRVTIIHT